MADCGASDSAGVIQIQSWSWNNRPALYSCKDPELVTEVWCLVMNSVCDFHGQNPKAQTRNRVSTLVISRFTFFSSYTLRRRLDAATSFKLPI